MGYFIRILSPSEAVPPVERLVACLKETAALTVEGPAEAWEGLQVRHPDGSLIAQVERTLVTPGSMGEEEIAEFLEQVGESRPESAARWLASYLPTVKTIYAFQILSGTYSGAGWDVVHALRDEIWSREGGIFQADNEGFSNEEGYHILWQFEDGVSGPWWMAVLQDGAWVPFQMMLGNRRQRKAFLAGEIPEGVKRLVESPETDVEKAYATKDVVAKLRRLADALEAGKSFEISIAGERIRMPADAAVEFEYECTDEEEAIEIELTWKRRRK